MGQRELFEEMTPFPYGDQDGLLAAATGCADLLHRREQRAWWRASSLSYAHFTSTPR